MSAPFRVKAVFDYSSPHEDDLNFAIGQLITVTDADEDDWYTGEYVDDDGVKHEGLFPRNFVEKFEPTAPPRPTRTRTKREPDEKEAAPAAPPAEQPLVVREEPPHVLVPAPAPVLPTREPEPEPESEPEIEEANEPLEKPTPVATAPAPAPAQAPVPAPAPSKPREPPAPAPGPAPAAAPSQPPKPKPSGPPPVAEKPASNSFKDRIAAFNKPAAPPIAPFKPGGGSGSFVKKPFVPPPPSRNAYVPPPREPPQTKQYRRDEDPEIKEKEAENKEQAEKAGLVPADEAGQQGDEEDQPKPTSLKERIALLQKQQVEQAQRHAEAASKKEKPKRPPPKKRTESSAPSEAPVEVEGAAPLPSLERRETEDAGATSTDEGRHISAPPPPRRKASRGPAAEAVHDGNEADMSGAGDTTEGHDDTTEREDVEEPVRHVSRPPTTSSAVVADDKPEKVEEAKEEEEEDDDDDEEEEDEDPEARRKEELRARMAKMSGGMGFHGMFGAPAPPPGPAPPKKKKTPKADAPVVEDDEVEASRTAPPVPMMALPGLGGPRKSEDTARPTDAESEPVARAPPPPLPSRQTEDVEDEQDEDGDEATTPAPTSGHAPRELGAPPPIPGGRPADSRPPPPPPPAELRSASDGSESDDELSGTALEQPLESISTQAARPPPLPPLPSHPPGLPMRSPPTSPRPEDGPTSPTSKRLSRPPPPIPGSAPGLPPAQSRPPPPPPPGTLSRQSTADVGSPFLSRPPQAGEEEDEENTEYEGDYDTDIASSVPHKDALKAHARDSSLEDNFIQSPAVGSPPSIPPPIPTTLPKAVPPPIPSHAPPENKRRSVDVPRAAPPPPPPPKEAIEEDDYDTYNHPTTPGGLASSYSKTPRIEEEEPYFSGQPQVQSPSVQSPPDRRAPPSTPGGRPVPRQSLDVGRPSMSGRRSVDVNRPSTELGFIANEIDLAVQSGWWRQANQVPPVLQGRRDIFFESEETTSTNKGSKTIVTREIFVLFQDYSQTILTVRYDPYDPSDVELEQRHDPPPRALRQDQMEEFYERFGRHISEAVAAKKDTVVGDGTPQGLILELLRPFRDALRPVGTRAYGALVYSNMANASTQQHDMIRPGDILTIRNAKFQGKHGAMHAKYTMEVGKPDHVAVVTEWDGTKKKVRAWEQGRESKKVKVESFKLDDLRSGEVRVWRVMPRSWVGWNSQP